MKRFACLHLSAILALSTPGSTAAQTVARAALGSHVAAAAPVPVLDIPALAAAGIVAPVASPPRAAPSVVAPVASLQPAAAPVVVAQAAPAFATPRRPDPGGPGWRKKSQAAVAALVLVGLLSGIGLGWHNETLRDTRVPVGFSEISQMEREAKAAGREIGPVARYLTGTNDMTMNVFNAWNIANAGTSKDSDSVVPQFARELDMNAGSKLQIHRYELPHYFSTLPKTAEAAYSRLAPYDALGRQAADANARLESTWDYDRVDVDRMETRWVTVDDGDGKSHIETVTEWVYDHSNHSYDYKPKEGEAASRSLDVLTQKGRDAVFTEDMRPAALTHADGEYAAETSRGRRQAIDSEEALSLAATWKHGSTLMNNLPVIEGRLVDLARDAALWRDQKNSAHDDYYSTNSKSDSGPREYQTVQRALGRSQELERSISEIMTGIEATRTLTPALEAKIKEFIAVTIDHQPGDSHKLSQEVMSLTRQIYTANFKKGFEVERFRAWVVVLTAVAGAAVGGLIGAGADWMARRRGWWVR